jgi:tetratricopeptide (TPR) repeat protein
VAAKNRKGKRSKAKLPEGYEFLALANQFRRAGRYEEALKICRWGLKNFPDYVSARAALGVILLEAGHNDEARAELEAVLEVAPTNLFTHRALGKLHLESGDLAEAKKAYEAVLWLAPEDAEALAKLESLGAPQEVETVSESTAGMEPEGDPDLAPEGDLEPQPEDSEPAADEDLELPEEEDLELPVDEDLELPEEEPTAEAEPPAEESSEEDPEKKARIAAENQALTGRLGELEAFQGMQFPELADMDLSDPQYTRKLAGLFEGHGYYKDAMISYQMALKENPDDEAIQQKIAELKQLQGFRERESETGLDLDALLSQEELQATVPDDGETEEQTTDLGTGPEGDGAEVEAEEPPSTETVDISQSSDFDRELSRAMSEGDEAQEGEGDLPTEPADGAAIADALPAEESLPVEEPEDLPVPEEDLGGEEVLATMEDSLADSENGQLPGPENVTIDLSEPPGEPVAAPVDDIDDGMANLSLDEPVPAESSPEPGEEAPAESVPESTSAATDPHKQETIHRLEGLLDRVRSKSDKDEKNTMA